MGGYLIFPRFVHQYQSRFPIDCLHISSPLANHAIHNNIINHTPFIIQFRTHFRCLEVMVTGFPHRLDFLKRKRTGHHTSVFIPAKNQLLFQKSGISIRIHREYPGRISPQKLFIGTFIYILKNRITLIIWDEINFRQTILFTQKNSSFGKLRTHLKFPFLPVKNTGCIICYLQRQGIGFPGGENGRFCQYIQLPFPT